MRTETDYLTILYYEECADMGIVASRVYGVEIVGNEDAILFDIEGGACAVFVCDEMVLPDDDTFETFEQAKAYIEREHKVLVAIR